MLINVNQIYNLDCLEFMKKIPNESIDLIFCDSPFNLEKDYGVDKDKRSNYYDWCADWIKEGFRILKPTGSIYLMTIQAHLKEMMIQMDKYGFMQNIVVWKNTSMPLKKKYTISYQPILYYTKSDKFTYNYDADSELYKGTLPYGRKPKGSTMKDLWDDIKFISGGCMASKEAILYPGTKKKYHKCQMPLALARRIIKASSNEGDIVYDMFSGSGTFVVEANELKRNFIGTELNKEYIDNIIIPRLAKYDYKSNMMQDIS